MLIAWLDVEFKYKWITFFLWLVSISLLAFSLLYKKKEQSENKNFSWKKYIPFLVILTIAIITRLYLLKDYPFHSIGDELRDGGWDAMRITDGDIDNIFFYGRYESHGLIIPTFTSIFYLIFGNSALTFRVAAMVIGILDVVLLYALVYRFLGKKTAFFAGLIFATLPLHLYYSRTEIVVIFSSLLTTLTLFALLYFFQRMTLKSIALLGLIVGFSFNFHASVRTVGFLAILIIVGYLTIRAVQENLKFDSVRKAILTFLVFMAMIVIGFGPRMLFTPISVFLHSRTSELSAEDPYGIKENKTIDERITKVVQAYPKSFMAYVYEPAYSHFQDGKPILNNVLSIFFMCGLVLAIFKNKLALYVLLIFAFVIPLTNSAITDTVNADHRLAPIFSIAAIFAAYGVVRSIMFVRKNVRGEIIYEVLLVSLVITTATLNVFNFFYKEPANISMFRFDRALMYQDFMVTQAIHEIKSDQQLYAAQSLCLGGNTSTYKFLELLHIKEQFYFFTPALSIVNIDLGEKVVSNDLYVFKNCDIEFENIQWEEKAFCAEYKKFECPPDKSNFRILIQK